MGYGILAINASPTIKNNIVVGNALAGIKVSDPLEQPPVLAFNDIWNNGLAGAANHVRVPDPTSS